MVLTITKVNAPQNKLNIKAPYSMDSIGTTTHETGNIATAMAEISYMIGNSSSTGYHFAVDDTRAVQGLPLDRNAFHSGDGKTGRGNRKTIGVEHCYNWNGKTTTKNDSHYNPLFQKAIKNGVELQAQLFLKYPHWGVPTAGVNMFRHYDHSKKNCPQRMIEEGYWNTYVALVKARYLELKGIKADPVTPAAPKVEPAKPTQTVSNAESIVDYLNKKEIDSSFGHRTKLAKQYGISNYSGTAAQNTQLLNKIKSGTPVASAGNSFKAYNGLSVVDFLNLNKIDSSFNNRKKLADQYGVKNYTGTASQNTALLDAMQKSGTTASKPKSNYTGSSLVDYLKSINIDSSFANRKKLAAQYDVKNYSGTAAQNSRLLNRMR